MSVRQFANSLSIIRRAEHRNRTAALIRHLAWQGRKLLFPLPARRRLSQSILIDDEPGNVISMVNMLGRYDFNNMHFVQIVLGQAPADSAPVFIDVGANVGAYTLIASEVPSATVVSLEPIPAAFAKLQRNVALNGRQRVLTLPLAAGRAPGELRMTCDGASSMNRVVADGARDRTILVRVETLDAICNDLALRPTLIKMDVEGHEPDVLAGASECLSACYACLIENGDRPEIVAFMRARGMAGPFHYRHRSATLQRSPQLLAEDQVFVSPQFAAAFPSITIVPA